MAEFYISLSNYAVAEQVAAMINKYNRWITKFSAQAILFTPADYFVELDGSKVIGCASAQPYDGKLTRVQHVCVLPEYRLKGIAKRLTELAISNSKTDYVYMTIREDNTASLNMAMSLKFKYVKKHWFRDHWTITLGRRKIDAA